MFLKGAFQLLRFAPLFVLRLLANEQEQGNEIDFTIFKVGTWLDDLDASELESIVEAMTESKILGNDLNAYKTQRHKINEGVSKVKPLAYLESFI